MLALALSTMTGNALSVENNAAFVNAAFLQILCRDPTAEEVKLCNDYLTKQTELLKTGRELHRFDSKETSPVQPSADPVQRAREGLVHTLFNHSDFVTIH
jgi:hypothetical protein